MTARSFHDRVLGWLREHLDPGAKSVEQVHPHGTDWAGDTVGGFYSVFDVDIVWRDAEGTQCSRLVEGEDMKSLWDAVIAEDQE